MRNYYKCIAWFHHTTQNSTKEKIEPLVGRQSQEYCVSPPLFTTLAIYIKKERLPIQYPEAFYRYKDVKVIFPQTKQCLCHYLYPNLSFYQRKKFWKVCVASQGNTALNRKKKTIQPVPRNYPLSSCANSA